MLPYCSLPQNCNLLLNLCYGLLDSWSVSYISFFVFLVNDCGVIQGHSPSYCYYCTQSRGCPSFTTLYLPLHIRHSTASCLLAWMETTLLSVFPHPSAFFFAFLSHVSPALIGCLVFLYLALVGQDGTSRASANPTI